MAGSAVPLRIASLFLRANLQTGGDQQKAGGAGPGRGTGSAAARRSGSATERCGQIGERRRSGKSQIGKGEGSEQAEVSTVAQEAYEHDEYRCGAFHISGR